MQPHKNNVISFFICMVFIGNMPVIISLIAGGKHAKIFTDIISSRKNTNNHFIATFSETERQEKRKDKP